jgi:hypothetical protein
MGCEMNVNIVTSDVIINSVWLHIIRSMFSCTPKCFTLYDISMLRAEDVVAVDLWIIEAFIDCDAVGFRTALSLAGTSRILLIVNPDGISNVNDYGEFWITYSFRGNLSQKIEKILQEQPRKRNEFEELLQLYPGLGNPPRNIHL